MKRLVIFGNTYHRGDLDDVAGLLQYLRQRDIEVAIEREYSRHLSSRGINGEPTFDANDVPAADMALSLGGDGTFLATAMWVSPQGMPILGLNLGQETWTRKAA